MLLQVLLLLAFMYAADTAFPTVFDVPAAGRNVPFTASSFVYQYWEPSPPPPPLLQRAA